MSDVDGERQEEGKRQKKKKKEGRRQDGPVISF